MKQTVHIERIYSTGQYENIKISFDAQIDTDNILKEVLALETRYPQTPKQQAPPEQKPTGTEEDLEYTQENGKLIIKPKYQLPLERFKEVTAKVKADGGKYVYGTSDTPGHWEVPA